MITNEIKQKITEALKQRRSNYQSASKMAVALGISNSQLSNVMAGKMEGQLSDANWISIARKMDVQISGSVELVTARTHVFEFITEQLKACQADSISAILCDITDIGKTYSAKWYCRNNRNAWYIDCSQVKSKSQLIRAIAKEGGLISTGRYQDVYKDLVFYLRSIPNPIIILDEAGDLEYPAFLELKALWNATDRACGWYMMGADGLKAKIERNLEHLKVGYAEILSRMGNRFQKITPDGTDKSDFIRQQVTMIGRANGIQDINKLMARTGGSLRRIYIEIQKMKRVEEVIA
jgi:DNA transposition AAA+ family ATPase